MRMRLQPHDDLRPSLFPASSLEKSAKEIHVPPPSSDHEDYFYIRAKQYCLTSASFFTARDGVRGEDEADNNEIRLALCNASAPEQRWLWTQNNQLLNWGSLDLCLAGIGTAKAVLQRCMDATSQQWRCAGSFIMQPSTGHCLTFDFAALSAISSLEEALDQALQESRAPAITLKPCNAKRDNQKWNARVNASEEEAHACSRAPEHSVAPCETRRLRSDAMGWITCSALGYYVNGIAVDDDKEILSAIHCCSTSNVFTGRSGGPLPLTSEECQLLETLGDNRSFECPQGMLLKGFYFLGANLGAKFVKCCRPNSSSQPSRYVHCFTDSLGYRQTDGERLTCRLPGYSITAMGSTKCGGRGNRCASEAKCCY